MGQSMDADSGKPIFPQQARMDPPPYEVIQTPPRAVSFRGAVRHRVARWIKQLGPSKRDTGRVSGKTGAEEEKDCEDKKRQDSRREDQSSMRVTNQPTGIREEKEIKQKEQPDSRQDNPSTKPSLFKIPLFIMDECVHIATRTALDAYTEDPIIQQFMAPPASVIEFGLWSGFPERIAYTEALEAGVKAAKRTGVVGGERPLMKTIIRNATRATLDTYTAHNFIRTYFRGALKDIKNSVNERRAYMKAADKGLQAGLDLMYSLMKHHQDLLIPTGICPETGLRK
ncbi:hypothetical protein GGR56DRAFT_517391 [Xylariaceae sp. FL0804]|nr:hypothetical protein GGR56DRAFT_517391 [Xylariaceae sp. FL0804]